MTSFRKETEALPAFATKITRAEQMKRAALLWATTLCDRVVPEIPSISIPISVTIRLEPSPCYSAWKAGNSPAGGCLEASIGPRTDFAFMEQPKPVLLKIAGVQLGLIGWRKHRKIRNREGHGIRKPIPRLQCRARPIRR